MSFELFMFLGGYWSPDDRYLGGESSRVATFTVEDFNMCRVLGIITEQLGYEDNMNKLSWFPPESPDTKVDIEDDETMNKIAHYGVGCGAATLYVVREDDPYIGRRIGCNTSLEDDEAVWMEDSIPNDDNVAEDGDSSGGSSSDASDSSGGEAGHNKTNCKEMPKPKPPKKPPGRPRTRQLPDAPGWTTRRAEGPPLLLEEWRPWNEDGSGTSSQPIKPSARACKKQKVSASQPNQDAPNLSSAGPKRKRGRPRKNEAEKQPYSQPELTSRTKEPVYDSGPRHIPREGFGVFTSPDTGDDYIHLGKSVVDARDNTVLPSSLYKARDAKKAKANAKKAKTSGAGFAQTWLSHSKP